MLPKILTIIFACFANLQAKPAKLERIVGGVSTSVLTVPYQVALHPKECGGSLLSSKWVITAAHCTFDQIAEEIYFAVSVQDRRQINYLYDVAQLFQHPKFNSNNFDNDIALLQSTKEVQFSRAVQPIKLTKTAPANDALVLVSGYGVTSSGGNSSYNLLSVYLNIFSYEECNRIHNFELTNNMICAYSDNVDSCQGDSGGPLVSNGKLVGIVSWGIDCALKGSPGVYTNVANYITWINGIIQEMKDISSSPSVPEIPHQEWTISGSVIQSEWTMSGFPVPPPILGQSQFSFSGKK